MEDLDQALVEPASPKGVEAQRAKYHELERELEALRAELEAKAGELAELRVREVERLESQAVGLSDAKARRLADQSRRSAEVNAQELERLARKNAALSEADARRLAEDARRIAEEAHRWAGVDVLEVERVTRKNATLSEADARRLAEDARRSTEGDHRLAEVKAQELERLARKNAALSEVDARRLAEDARRLATENRNERAEAAVMARSALKMAADASQLIRTAEHDAAGAKTIVDAEDRGTASGASPGASGIPTGVGIFANGRPRGWFEPTNEPYVSDGPDVSVLLPENQFLPDSQKIRTADGSVVSGFRFIGWHEGKGTRVMVFVLIPREGVDNTYLPDGKEKNLMPREFSSHLVGPTGEVPVSKMRELGLQPMVLRQMPNLTE